MEGKINRSSNGNCFAHPVITGPRPKVIAAPNIVAFVENALKRQEARMSVYRFERTLSPSLQSNGIPLKILEEALGRSLEAMREPFFRKRLDQYGTKHANLVRMGEISEALALQDLEIPAPRGIASDDILAFLPQEVFDHWEALKEAGIESLKTPQAKKHLNAIEQAIDSAFSRGTLNLPIDWLEERKRAGDFLMVRSTGDEDSKQTANAGGNISCAYVEPSVEAFMQAAGAVVKSYFSVDSLQNRINAGVNPFKEPLKLAITAQPLIGEPVGGATSDQIPVSFVLFTNEPLYIGKEKFRVSRLSATFGHGEGVVGNRGIATDTVLILQSESRPDQLYILYDNQKKPERLAPIQQGAGVVLSKVKNPDALTERPVLTHEQVAAIYRSGIVMEKSFGDSATDIEGVVLRNRVYFVQARPVNRKPLLPTFLKSKEGVVVKVHAEALVPGKASVVVATTKKEVLFTKTLEEAQRQFVEGTHKLIVVSQPEPQNSHPVVNFSSLGVPCLYTSNPDGVEQLLDQIDVEHCLATCMQTATLHLWKGPLGDAIQEGFAVHPAKIAISLPVQSEMAVRQSSEPPPKELPALLIQLREARTPEAGQEILCRIKGQICWIEKEIARFEASTIPGEVQQGLEILKELNAEISHALEEMDAILMGGAERLQKLLHFKILETLLLGSKQKNRIGGYVLSDARKIVRSLDLAIAYQNQFSHRAHCIDLLLAGSRAATREAFSSWKTFLTELEFELEKGTIALQTLQDLVSSLEKAGALSAWLVFLPNSQESDPLSTFKQQMDEITPADRILLQELTEMQTSIEQMHTHIDRFANSTSYERAWRELSNLVNEVSSVNWRQKIRAASPTTSLIAYKVMGQAIALLDDSHKTVKKSDQFPPGVKETLFKKMLFSYLEMTKSWANIVPSIGHHVIWPPHKYFHTAQQILCDLDEKNQNALRPSRDFSVAAAILNAGTEFSRHQPQSLEDMLTLCHQNGLSFISILTEKLFPQEKIEQSMLPEPLKQAIKQVNEQGYGMPIQQQGIDINEHEIVVNYNVPLRNHSGHIALIYDTRTSTLVMRGRFLGEARTRWAGIAKWARILEEAGLFSSEEPLFQGEQELKFSWKIPPKMLSNALHEYVAMALASLQSNMSNGREMTALVRRWAKHPKIGALIDVIMPITMKMFQSKDSRSTAIDLFGTLAEQGQRIEVAIQTAVEAIKSPDSSIRHAAIDLFGTLAKKGRGIEVAIQTAVEAIKSPDSSIRHAAIDLFIKLVEQGQGFEAATQAATGMSTRADLTYNVYTLFEKLVEQGQCFEAAIQAATEAFTRPDLEVAAIILFKKLVKQGQGFEAATQAATKALNNRNFSQPDILLDLFIKLAQQGQGFKAAIQAATKASLRKRVNRQKILEGITLFTILFMQRQGFEAGIQTATEMFNSSDPELPWLSSDLFKALFAQGQGFEAAIQVATKMFNSADSYRSSYYLLREVIQHGHDLDLASLAAIEAHSRDSNKDVRENSQAFFKERAKLLAQGVLQHAS